NGLWVAALTISLSCLANRLQSTDTMAEERHLGQNLVGARPAPSHRITTTVVLTNWCWHDHGWRANGAHGSRGGVRRLHARYGGRWAGLLRSLAHRPGRPFDAEKHLDGHRERWSSGQRGMRWCGNRHRRPNRRPNRSDSVVTTDTLDSWKP